MRENTMHVLSTAVQNEALPNLKVSAYNLQREQVAPKNEALQKATFSESRLL